MKRVALLSFDWNYEIMSAYYEGMESYLQGVNGVQLVIFNAYGQYANYEPEAGALEVFSLCDLKRFDGFLIQGNRTWPPAMRQKLADEMRAQGKPVVSINYELEGTHAVGTDNYTAMYGLVRKVLIDRRCERPAFVMGLASSLEAQARQRAFEDACVACGIAHTRTYQASWEMESGIEAAKQMLAHQDELPDAIFCCNDDLAVGVQETLQAAGVRVPQDVLITGFDNREIALRATPRITTIDRDYRTIGRTALSTLVSLLVDEKVPELVMSPARYILSESCGYANVAETRQEMAASLYERNYALKHFYEVLTRFQPAVLGADTLSEILHECERYFGELRCPNAYLCGRRQHEADQRRLWTRDRRPCPAGHRRHHPARHPRRECLCHAVRR